MVQTDPELETVTSPLSPSVRLPPLAAAHLTPVASAAPKIEQSLYRVDRAWKQMLLEHTPGALPHGTRGGDKGHFTQHEHLTAHNPSHGKPFDEAKGEHHDHHARIRDQIPHEAFRALPAARLKAEAQGIQPVFHIVIERSDEDHDEKDARDGLQHLGGSHHESIHLPSSIAADHAVERADDEADERTDQTYAEGHTRAGQHAVKHVLAVHIRA
jgi:hypothetical protein